MQNPWIKSVIQYHVLVAKPFLKTHTHTHTHARTRIHTYDMKVTFAKFWTLCDASMNFQAAKNFHADMSA